MTRSATCAISEVSHNPSYYRAEQYDPDLGLYYLRARYYNPATGRFMSRDPEDGEPIDPKTLHKYLYVGGDPVNSKDPRGREAIEENFSFSFKKFVAGAVLAAYVFREFAEAFGLIGEDLAKYLGPTQHDPKDEPGEEPPKQEGPPVDGPPEAGAP